MGGLRERLAVLEEGAARQQQVTVPDMSPEEAARIYREMKAEAAALPSSGLFDGVPASRHIEVYLERIGAGAGRVPKGRG